MREPHVLAAASSQDMDPLRGLWPDQRRLAVDLTLKIRAGARLHEILGDEDDRVEEVAQACARELGLDLQTWDATTPSSGSPSVSRFTPAAATSRDTTQSARPFTGSGREPVHREVGPESGRRTGEPFHNRHAGFPDARQSLHDLLRQLLDERAPSVWLLRDVEHFEDAVSIRALRRLAQSSRGAIVLVHARRSTAVGKLPEVRRDRLPFPSAAQLHHEFGMAARAHQISADAAVLHRWTRAALGLPLSQARHAFLHAVADLEAQQGIDLNRHEHNGDDQDPASREKLGTREDHARITASLTARKAEALLDSSVLEALPSTAASTLGGLHHLKRWLARRTSQLGEGARAAGLTPARGVLLLGIPGCGKSLAAQVCADLLSRPLLRLDPGRLFGSLLGESEANLRHALALAEHVAPAVLWIDEVDKHLGRGDASASDGGTSSRVMGELLTWLQERRCDVFVVATANRIESLPPEFLRRGRLDEIFFVDLPDAPSREEILRIHLLTVPMQINGSAPPLADPLEAYLSVASQAHDRTGAEIEAAVREARWIAFQHQRMVAAADLRAALAETVPLAKSHALELERIRVWARDHARPA